MYTVLQYLEYTTKDMCWVLVHWALNVKSQVIQKRSLQKKKKKNCPKYRWRIHLQYSYPLFSPLTLLSIISPPTASVRPWLISLVNCRSRCVGFRRRSIARSRGNRPPRCRLTAAPLQSAALNPQRISCPPNLDHPVTEPRRFVSKELKMVLMEAQTSWRRAAQRQSSSSTV